MMRSPVDISPWAFEKWRAKAFATVPSRSLALMTATKARDLLVRPFSNHGHHLLDCALNTGKGAGLQRAVPQVASKSVSFNEEVTGAGEARKLFLPLRAPWPARQCHRVTPSAITLVIMADDAFSLFILTTLTLPAGPRDRSRLFSIRTV